MSEIKDPWIIKKYFTEDKLSKIIDSVNSFKKEDWTYDEGFKRYTNYHPYGSKMSMLELDRARKEFNNSELLYTYSLFSLYNSNESNLTKHKDDNACTYTIDICLYAKKPWDIYVEGIPYTLNSNDALFFYGADQLHWRETIPKDNSVLMMFMHFADRDHWWFQSNNVECI